MLKFFRKYNKIILVIGGAFLMVSFLLMDSIGRMGSSLGLSLVNLSSSGACMEQRSETPFPTNGPALSSFCPQLSFTLAISTSSSCAFLRLRRQHGIR